MIAPTRKLDTGGWHLHGSETEYNLSRLDPEEYYDVTFYKERWEPTRMTTGEVLKQRLIITFSFKYREYLSYVLILRGPHLK